MLGVSCIDCGNLKSKVILLQAKENLYAESKFYMNWTAPLSQCHTILS